MSVEEILRKLINTHASKLAEYKNLIDFKKQPLVDLIENYFTNSIKFPNKTTYVDWLITELTNKEKDILLVFNEDTYRSFTDFKNVMYKDVSKATFESIVERVHITGSDLESPYTQVNYKVIIMDYNITRYKTKVSSYIAKNFPKIEFVLGIN